jgi:hypothetical protein
MTAENTRRNAGAQVLFIAMVLLGWFCPIVKAQTGLLDPPATEIRTFQVFELRLGARNPGKKPYLSGPEITATFTRREGGRRVTIKGFWDGGNVFRIRFSATQPGTYDYRTRSRDSGLNGFQGTVIAYSPTLQEINENPLRRGFLKANGSTWRLSDGSPFLLVGDLQYSLSDEILNREFKQWVNVLAERGFNSIQGCAWLGITEYNRTGIHPFQGAPKNGDMNPRFFQRLDRLVEYANSKGLIFGMMIGGFPGNSQWWNRLFTTREDDDRWFAYIVARYSAYNVRWILYGEVDEGNKTPWKTTWTEEVSYKAALVRTEDPYDHPIGCHHTPGKETQTASIAYLDYLEVQINRSEDQWKTARALRQFRKPIWFEEYFYEFSDDFRLGIRNTHRNFVAGLAFPTIGSLMRAHHRDSAFPPSAAASMGLSLEEYLRRYDHAMLALQRFTQMYAKLNTVDFEPYDRASRGSAQGVGGKFGVDYAFYVPAYKRETKITVSVENHSRTWSVSVLNLSRIDENVKTFQVRGKGNLTIETGTTNPVAVVLRRM